jgi:hypothetical protein
MKPLVTQKIEFGVRLENDEIVGEKKKQCPGKEEMVVVWGKEKANALDGIPSVGRHMPGLSLLCTPRLLCSATLAPISPYEDKYYSILCLHH